MAGAGGGIAAQVVQSQDTQEYEALEINYITVYVSGSPTVFVRRMFASYICGAPIAQKLTFLIVQCVTA